MNTKNLLTETQNLVDKLNNPESKITFLFGAGSSICANLPDMYKLTEKVETMLETGVHEETFTLLKNELNEKQHIEHILSFLEEVSQLSNFSKLLYKDGKPDHDWEGLRFEIKKCIASIIDEESNLDCQDVDLFSDWLESRARNTEIYTTNYDLVFESAFERKNLFYFDGFVGGLCPNFQAGAVDPVGSKMSKEVRPPDSWIRLWKLHGSINWEIKTNERGNIVRRSPNKIDSCLIYPSSSKYSDSRRMPYIVLQDKFRRALSKSKTTLLISGYGFGDEHLNEIIFDSLENNKGLDVNVLNYLNLSDGSKLDEIAKKGFLNLSIFTPENFIHQGKIYEWENKETCFLGDTAHFYRELVHKTSTVRTVIES